MGQSALGPLRLVAARAPSAVYHTRRMIFVDYLGAADRFPVVRDAVTTEVAAAFRMPPGQVRVRRLVTDDAADAVELWIELSSEEQLYRQGRQVAERVAQALRGQSDIENVWVMFRIVPLSHAFLNGEPRGRGIPTFE